MQCQQKQLPISSSTICAFQLYPFYPRAQDLPNSKALILLSMLFAEIPTLLFATLRQLENL